jgi:hypothetical protein
MNKMPPQAMGVIWTTVKMHTGGKLSGDLVSGVRVGEKGLCWDYSMDGNFGKEWNLEERRG